MTETALSWSGFGYAAGAALGLLLAALLLVNPHGNRAANRWLAVLVAALALLSLNDLFVATRYVLRVPHAALIFDWLILVVGPCMWLYVHRLTGAAGPTGFKQLLHFLPALLLLFALTPFYLLSPDEKRQFIDKDLLASAQGVQWTLLPAAIQIIAYWMASLAVMQQFRSRLRDQFSSIERLSLNWLTVMLIATLVLWGVWVLGLVLNIGWAQPINDLSIPLGIYVLAFLALRQPAVFIRWSLPPDSRGHVRPIMELVPTPSPAPEPKYARSGLSEERALAILEKLDQVMRLEKPWMENELSLADLASRVGCSPQHLSEIFSQRLGKSFFDLVNEQRVAEVKRCLADPAYRTESILEIALAAGFSSKATFNSVFRKHSGVAPSEFRRQHASAA